MTTIETEIFSRTDAEYRKIDKLTAQYRELFKVLKALEEIGQYGTEKWTETFTKYAETFKKVNGYRPHWVR